MNLKKIALLVFGLLFFLNSPCTSISSDKDLRNTLEIAYTQFIKSSQSEDEETIRGTMSSSAYAISKNDCTKSGKSFISLMKQTAKHCPDISDLNFIKIQRKGPTASLLYSKDSEYNFAPDQPMIDFIFIKFVNEKSSWRLDRIKIASTAKYNKDGSLKEFDESELSPEYKIDGKIH
jgi:hypothetical protein